MTGGQAGRQADRQKKPLIGARATALPKNDAKFWTLSERGGGSQHRSQTFKLFIEEKYGHVYRGGVGGWSSLFTTVFCIKVFFVGP